jgi:hypothetical protein
MTALETIVCKDHPSFKKWLPKAQPKPTVRYSSDDLELKQRIAKSGYAQHVFHRRLQESRWGVAQRLVQCVVAAPSPQTNIEKRFIELAKRWREETKAVSSTTDRALNSAYQDIIGMGRPVVSLILREMATNGGHWFWALRHITHDNPVPQQDAGNIKKMREAWLQWGQENHYL